MAPPAVLAGAAGVIRVGGIPVAQLAVQRLRWWHGTTAGHTSYRAEIVKRHTGVLQLPGTLAATELLSAEDGYGGRYGLVRDQRTGYLTATLRVVPTSTWLADTGDADGWVANWGGWLASLGYLPAVRWVTVTVDTAPDPGSTLTDQVAAAIDTSAPRAALHIMDQLVATAPAAAADVDTRVSITVQPGRRARRAPQPHRGDHRNRADPDRPGIRARLLRGHRPGPRPRRRPRRDRAHRVRPRRPRRREPAAGHRDQPAAGGTAELGQRRPGRRGGSLGLLPARQRRLGQLRLARSAPPERPRRRAGPPAGPRPLPEAGRAAVPAAARLRRGRRPWTARSAPLTSAASTPAAPAAT